MHCIAVPVLLRTRLPHIIPKQAHVLCPSLPPGPNERPIIENRMLPLYPSFDPVLLSLNSNVNAKQSTTDLKTHSLSE
jgi:hypothetical protein